VEEVRDHVELTAGRTAVALGLLAPGLVDDPATKRSLVAHAGVRRIADLWQRLEVAAFGIGGPTWSAAALGPDLAAELDRSGAVGEVLVSPFDLDGQFVCKALRDRTIAFDARDLGRVPVRIGVAGGPSKVRPILGALRGGMLTVLVTDQPTAEAVLALADGSAR
jgi:DNA-binding transcriptional regulator LsrR (DeoR family)